VCVCGVCVCGVCVCVCVCVCVLLFKLPFWTPLKRMVTSLNQKEFTVIS